MHAPRSAVLLSGLLVSSACGESVAPGQDTDREGETEPSTGTDSGQPGTSDGPGSGSSSGASTGSDTSSGTEPIDALGQAYCGKLFSCCDGAELAEELKFYDPTPMTEAECVEIIGGLVAYEATSIGQAEAQGRLVFHTDEIAACAEAIDAASCEAWDVDGDPFRDLVDDPACAAMVEPLATEGDPCGHARECITQNCSLGEGVCIPAGQALGEPCEVGLSCNDDTYCDSTTDPWTCQEKAGPGEQCLHDNACHSRLCEGESTGTPGVCLALCDGA